MNTPLTRREQEVLQSIVRRGYNPKDIQQHMGISFHTWKAHLQGAYSKLKVDNIVDALLTAIREGIISMDKGLSNE